MKLDMFFVILGLWAIIIGIFSSFVTLFYFLMTPDKIINSLKIIWIIVFTLTIPGFIVSIKDKLKKYSQSHGRSS